MTLKIFAALLLFGMLGLCIRQLRLATIKLMGWLRSNFGWNDSVAYPFGLSGAVLLNVSAVITAPDHWFKQTLAWIGVTFLATSLLGHIAISHEHYVSGKRAADEPNRDPQSNSG